MTDKNVGLYPTHDKFSKFLVVSLRIVISGIIALVILTFLCKFRLNTAKHFVDPAGATDYKYEPNVFWLQGLEGYGFGRTNNDGYNCMFSYETDMSIPILMLGSSYMLAEEIVPEENTASLLSLLSGKIVYNLGMGAHDFETCSANFESAMKKYKPDEYALIETDSVSFSDDKLKRIIDHEVFKQPAYDKGIAALLRSNNFLRLMYHQFFRKLIVQLTMPIHDSPKDSHHENNSELLSEVLGGLKRTASEHNVKLIIAYHPEVSLNVDGTLSINHNPENVKQFSEICAQNGIYFLDMSDRFLDEYAKDYTLPYGFRNSSVGKGHMNKYGHRMFAEEIYKLIQRIEAQS